MKRQSAPKQPGPATVDPLARLCGIGRGVLLAHLLLTPLLFTQATVEGFEFVKFLALVTTALILLAVSAAALPYLSWNRIRLELGHPVTLAGMVFVVSASLSTLASTDWQTSFYGHYENYSGLITITAYLVLYVAAKALIHTPQQMRHMLLAVACATCGVTIYGLLQAVRLDPFVWADPSKVGGYVRPFSTMGHANYLGAWLVLALPLVIFLATKRTRIAIAMLVLAMGALLVLTMSRAAWLGLLGAGVVALIVHWRRGSEAQKRIVLASVGIIGCMLAATLLSSSFRATIASRTERFLDDAGRAQIWSAAIKIFAERPIVGRGPDTFQHHFGRHEGVAFWEHSWRFTPTRAHNEILHVLATQGALGLLAMIAILAAVVWSLRRAWQLHPDQRILIGAIALAIGGYFVTELFGFTVIACGSLLIVLSAMAARLAERPGAECQACSAPRVTLPWRFAQAAVAVGCGFLFAYLVADPLRADLQSASASLVRTPEEALRRHQEAVRICPRCALYWSRYAGCAEALGRWEPDVRRRADCYRLARDAFAQAAAREPGNGYHRAGLGRAHAELARLGRANPVDAFAAFDAALERDPSVAYFYVDASQAALQLGDAERAAAYVRAGLERYPSYGAMRRQAAMLHLLHNRPLEAIPEFDRALAADWKGEVSERESTAAIRAEVIRRIGGRN